MTWIPELDPLAIGDMVEVDFTIPRILPSESWERLRDVRGSVVRAREDGWVKILFVIENPLPFLDVWHSPKGLKLVSRGLLESMEAELAALRKEMGSLERRIEAVRAHGNQGAADLALESAINASDSPDDVKEKGRLLFNLITTKET